MSLSDILSFFGINDEKEDENKTEFEDEEQFYYEPDETVVTFTVGNGLDGGDVVQEPYYIKDN